MSDGYARNFLLPRKLAKEANAQSINDIKNKERAEQYRIEQEKKAATELAKKLEGTTIKLFAKAGQSGKLFGSVTSKEIADEVSKLAGVQIDKRKITLDGDIKTFGTYQSEVKLYTGISAKFYVLVSEQ